MSTILRKENSAPISDEPTHTPSQTLPLQVKAGGEVQGEPSSAKQEVPAARTEKVAFIPAEPEIKAASLFLSNQASRAGLFRLFDAKERQNSHSAKEVHLGMYLSHAEPEHHIMFKRPFRVCVAGPAHDPGFGHTADPPSPQYLLIREVTADGAIAIDAEGKEQLITRDFILTHWDKKVSWVYPYEDYDVELVRGMRGPDVIRLQYALNETGYSIQPTGRYDGPTFDRVVSFQSDFGLTADGIVGTRTKGLLYQMTDELYP